MHGRLSRLPRRVARAACPSSILRAGAGTVGLFYGEGKLLGAAVLAGLSIIAWSGLIGMVLWGTLRRLDWLRVSAEAELIGVDHGQHGGSAYAKGESIGTRQV